MALFLFQPDKEYEVVEVFPATNVADMSYLYNSKNGKWLVMNPKTRVFIPFMQEGVPEIYKAQVLLLSAAYPD